MAHAPGGFVLALDTSGDPCSVSLQAADGTGATLVAGPGPRAGESLHPLLEQLLASGGVEVRDLLLVAAARGPGSFTGLRVGLAAAGGLSLAGGVPAAGIETTRAIAQASGLSGEIWAVLEGGQGRFFAGRHESRDGVVRPLEGPFDLSPRDLLDRIAASPAPVVLRAGAGGTEALAPLAAAGAVRCDGPLAAAIAWLARTDGPAAGPLDALYARAPAVTAPSSVRPRGDTALPREGDAPPREGDAT